MKETLRAAACVVLLSLIYWIVRLPASGLPLGYYDDGETLYHTFSILSGDIPHRDDVNHHFSGYLIPFVLGAKLFGFSPALITQVAFFNQVLMGLGVYFILRIFTSYGMSILGALLAICAREPWILGFFPQQQTNLVFVYLLFSCLQWLRSTNPLWLGAAGLLAGFAFICDQRAVFLSLVPASAILIHRPLDAKIFLASSITVLISFSIAPTLSLLYLWSHQALNEFIFQTWTYPSFYRVGSKSLSEILIDGVIAHRHLFTQGTLVTCTALLGFLQALRRAAKENESFFRRAATLICACAVPLAIMSLFGGRDFEYYTITWLPHLAILSVLSVEFFRLVPTRIIKLYRVALVLPIVLAVIEATLHAGDFSDYKGDGVNETVAFLRDTLETDDTLFVWGYRPEIYARLQKKSPYPFVSQIMIHPDSKIKGAEERQKHVYPLYEQRFFELLRTAPPDVIVTFYRERKINSPSAANTRIMELLAANYTLVFEISKPDFLDVPCFFEIYRRND